MRNALLPSHPPAIDYERRRYRRVEVRLAVELSSGGQPQLAGLLDISREGARLQITQPLPVGAAATIRCAGVSMEARIAWARDEQVGVRLVSQIDESSFLKLRRSA